MLPCVREATPIAYFLFHNTVAHNIEQSAPVCFFFLPGKTALARVSRDRGSRQGPRGCERELATPDPEDRATDRSRHEQRDETDRARPGHGPSCRCSLSPRACRSGKTRQTWRYHRALWALAEAVPWPRPRSGPCCPNSRSPRASRAGKIRARCQGRQAPRALAQGAPWLRPWSAPCRRGSRSPRASRLARRRLG